MASVIFGWSKHASRMVRSNGISLLLSSQPPKHFRDVRTCAIEQSLSTSLAGGDYSSDCIPPDVVGSNAKSSQVKKKEACSGHDDQRRHISASATVTDYERFENWCKTYGMTFSSEEEKYCLFKLYQIGYATRNQHYYAIDLADWQHYARRLNEITARSTNSKPKYPRGCAPPLDCKRKFD